MKRHNRGRALAASFLVALLGIGMLPMSVLGATIPARAAVLPLRQFVGDLAGRVLTFRVRNSGTLDGIGSVRIEPPSSFWTETACPSAPAGWTRALVAGACEFTSAAGNGDDIPQGEGRYFKVRATTGPSDHNVWGTWRVRLSPDDELAPIENVVDAAPMGLGLRMRAFTFEVVDAVISDSSASVGSPCPAPDKSAVAGSAGNFVVVCGRNHANATLTPVNANSKLLGSMVASHGVFTGGPIPASNDVVVLGYWSNVQVTANVGTGKALRLRVGSANGKTSPVRRIAGFAAVGGPAGNNAPVANNDSAYSTGEDTQLSVVASGVLGNDTDADLDTLVVSSVQGSSANVGNAAATAQGGTVNLAADGSFVFDPKPDFFGADSFTYTVSDGTDGSASATVSITVNAVNDPPTAANASFAMNENTSATFTVPGVLDDAADVDLDSLQAILVVGPTQSASFSLNSDGSFSYQPVANYVGADSFTWKARDPSGAELSVVTLSITINNVGGGGGGGGCLKSC